MLSRTTRGLRALLAVGLVGVALAGCGDDDDTTTAGGGDGENAISIEMKDYSYVVKGDLTQGLATITTTNTGDELHMVSFAKMKSGVTLDEVKDELEAQFSEGSGEGEEEGDESTSTTEDALQSPEMQLIAQTSSTTSTTEGEVTTQQEGEGEGEGGGEGEDPFAKFFEEDEDADGFGHILQPGREQSLTGDILSEGKYALICFIPTVEEGVPHVAKGMIAELEVGGDESTAEEPEADATYALSDGEAPEGPAELEAGVQTLEFTADSSNNEIIGALPDDGESFKSMDEWFTEIFEGGEAPEEGYMDDFPGELSFNVFMIPNGKTIWVTVDLEEGDYEFVTSTSSDDEEEEEGNDHVLKVKVA